jgi:hypothetical protein
MTRIRIKFPEWKQRSDLEQSGISPHFRPVLFANANQCIKFRKTGPELGEAVPQLPNRPLSHASTKGPSDTIQTKGSESLLVRKVI